MGMEMMWQPIATVPNTLDEVLLYWPFWSQRAVIGGRNYDVEDDVIVWLASWHTERWSSGDDATDPGPTHWMPLPDPPSELFRQEGQP